MTTGTTEEFASAAEQHRRELHVHCYRMLASYDEAEDAVGDTYLRAWRSRDGFDGENLRAWLYRIATNVCIDRQRAQARRLSAMRSYAEVSWLTPYPDTVLDEVRSADEEPDAVAVSRETVELAFVAALQALPPRQRAALLARDVLATVGGGDRTAARDVVGGGQQCAPARAGDDEAAPPVPPRRLERPAGERRGGRSARCLHRRPRELRRSGRARRRCDRSAGHDAAAAAVLRRRRRRRTAAGACLRRRTGR